MGCASLPLSYTAGTNLNKGIISFAARFDFAARIELIVHPQFFFRRDADALFLLVISLFSLFFGFGASAFRQSITLRMHFSCFGSFGQLLTLDFGHLHLSFLDFADALFSCLMSLA